MGCHLWRGTESDTTEATQQQQQQQVKPKKVVVNILLNVSEKIDGPEKTRRREKIWRQEATTAGSEETALIKSSEAVFYT